MIKLKLFFSLILNEIFQIILKNF